MSLKHMHEIMPVPSGSLDGIMPVPSDISNEPRIQTAPINRSTKFGRIRRTETTCLYLGSGCRSKMIRFICISYLMVYPVGSTSGNKISWTMKEYPYSKHAVVLQCNLPDIPNSCNSSSLWLGGPNKTLLAFNNNSSDSGKYRSHRNEQCTLFELVIKQFGNEDVNCNYTCNHGVSLSYTGYLSLDDNTYKRLPTNGSIAAKSQEVNNTWMAVTFVMNDVFPIPVCVFEATQIFFSAKPTHNGTLRISVEWHFFVETSGQCDIDLTYNCSIGQDKISGGKQIPVNTCTGIEGKNGRFIFFLLLILPVLVIVLFFVVWKKQICYEEKVNGKDIDTKDTELSLLENDN